MRLSVSFLDNSYLPCHIWVSGVFGETLFIASLRGFATDTTKDIELTKINQSEESLVSETAIWCFWECNGFNAGSIEEFGKKTSFDKGFIASMNKFAVSCRFVQIYLRILTILTWKNLYFAKFSTEFIEIHGWLPLTFFICLLNQLRFFNSIIVQMSEKRDSSNRQ